jgi:hypothetical protein
MGDGRRVVGVRPPLTATTETPVGPTIARRDHHLGPNSIWEMTWPKRRDISDLGHINPTN